MIPRSMLEHMIVGMFLRVQRPRGSVASGTANKSFMPSIRVLAHGVRVLCSEAGIVVISVCIVVPAHMITAADEGLSREGYVLGMRIPPP